MMIKLFFWLKNQTILHFLLLGAALVWIDQLLNPAELAKIKLSVESQHQLLEEFQESFYRPATAVERQRLFQQAVQEEVLYREAVARALDQHDEIIRRRLIQKMQFLVQGMSSVPAPQPGELAEYLNAHAEKFRVPRQTSFTQVYVKEQNSQRLVQIQSKLDKVSPADARLLGDNFLHGSEFQRKTYQQIENYFGSALARTVDQDNRQQKWLGPFQSSYGYHYVYINQITPAQVPPLDHISSEVYAAWKTDQSAIAEKNLLEQWSKNYIIEVEQDNTASEKSAAQVATR